MTRPSNPALNAPGNRKKDADYLAASRLSFPVIESDAELVDTFAWRNNSKDKRSPLKRSTKCNSPLSSTTNKPVPTTPSKTGHLPDRLVDNVHSGVHDHAGADAHPSSCPLFLTSCRGVLS